MIAQIERAIASLQQVAWILALLVVTAGVVAEAQLPTATLLGSVKDNTGAVVPGAGITARNLETGQTRTTRTAGDGSYRLTALPVGIYEISVEHPGFRTGIRTGLALAVAQEARIDFALEVGAVQEQVTVTAEAPLVNTSSGALGGLVDEQKVADLPLNGRNYINLTLLQPGVTHQLNRPLGSNNGTYFSSNGASPMSNTYLLDGASMTVGSGGVSSSSGGTTLGVEGIREYRVLTNAFSAEYGKTVGAQVLIVSKSGTNTFHGSAFEYLRNHVLDARNFFDYTTPTTPGRLPAFKRNNFGGSFGGPIRKDKTFFFGVYEGLRERKGITSVANVIPPSAKLDGGLVPQIAPVVKPFLEHFPDPNLPGNRYTFPFSQPFTENYGQIRVDQTFSAADTAFVRYTIDDGELTQLQSALPQFVINWRSRSQFGTLSESHVFSPVLLNTFRFSYSRTHTAYLNGRPGFVGPQFSYIPGQEAGALRIGGLSNWGSSGAAPFAQKQNIFTWSDDMFYTRGRHALKFGTLINRQQLYVVQGLTAIGQIVFPNLTQFLLGQPSTYVASAPGSINDRTWHHTTMGFYVQDDLRIRPNLMLNLGLRYEFHTTLQEAHGISAAWRNVVADPGPTVGPPSRNPSLRNFGPRIGFAWDVAGNGYTSVRGGFGVLYDVANLGEVLSTAYCNAPFCGLTTVSNPPTLTLPLVFPPGISGTSLQGLDYNIQQPYMLQYNLTVERQLPWQVALTASYAGSRGINLMQVSDGNPTVPQILPDGRPFWSGRDPRMNPRWGYYEIHTASGNSWYNAFQFGVLKRLSHGLQFQSAYTWSRTIDQASSQQSDNPSTGSFPVYPARIDLDQGVAGFDVAHNWRFNAIYRLPEIVHRGGLPAKLLNGWWVSGILSLQTPLPFTPTLQTQRSRSGVQGGSTQRSLSASTDRPDLGPGIQSFSSITSGVSRGCPGVPAGTRLHTPDLWYDPCAFRLQPAGFIGSAGRAILRGPGLANLDFSVTKDTGLPFLGESGKLEIRAEVFNILNHANFQLPSLGGASGNTAAIVFSGTGDVGIPLPTTGKLNQTSTTSRQLQFALKLLF